MKDCNISDITAMIAELNKAIVLYAEIEKTITLPKYSYAGGDATPLIAARNRLYIVIESVSETIDEQCRRMTTGDNDNDEGTDSICD